MIDVFFFFQAEDGIRDFHVTGVQTCALPICPSCPREGIAWPRRQGGRTLRPQGHPPRATALVRPPGPEGGSYASSRPARALSRRVVLLGPSQDWRRLGPQRAACSALNSHRRSPRQFGPQRLIPTLARGVSAAPLAFRSDANCTKAYTSS